jgi:hypothetical protein
LPLTRANAIIELQEAFNRIAGAFPSLKIEQAYIFGSLLRNLKKTIGDVDLVIVADSEVVQFPGKLAAFLSYPSASRETLVAKYDELRESRRIAQRQRSKWPPLSEFVSNEPVRSMLVAEGIRPEWLALYTWTEICDWSRYGMPNYQLLTSERLVHRALFGFKQGFQITKVAGSLKEATKTLVTEQLALAWSPEKPDVAENLTLSSAEQRAVIDKEYQNMWVQLQTTNARNCILDKLCHHLISQLREGKYAAEIPPDMSTELATSANVSEPELREFLENAIHYNKPIAISDMPSPRVGKAPELSSDQTVEEVRAKLEKAMRRMRVLWNIRRVLSSLICFRRQPSDLNAYLLECVPLGDAPKKFTLSVIHDLVTSSHQ